MSEGKSRGRGSVSSEDVGATTPTEVEVEVHVRQIDEATPETPPMAELMRRLLLASIGAVAMSYDEVERFTQRLVERGELAQKDGEKVVNEVMEKFRQRPQQMQATSAEVSEKVEHGLEQLLTRLNIPSKRDIDDLSAKLAQLAARIEELRRNPS